MGQAFNKLGDVGHADAAFSAAVVLAPGNSTAQQGLAVTLLREGRPGDALTLLQRLDDGGSDPDLLLAEGTALDMLGRSAEAQAVYRRALRTSPADARLHGNLALSMAVTGDVPKALHEIELAIDAPQPDPRQTANSVMILAMAGQRQQAETQGVAALGTAQTAALIARAEAAAKAPDAPTRARALGLIQ